MSWTEAQTFYLPFDSSSSALIWSSQLAWLKTWSKLTMCRLLFWYPFHPCVTKVAHKRSWSFCQKCRWQVTAKHTSTLCMWLNLHEVTWHGVHNAPISLGMHQPCNNQTILDTHTTSVDIQNMLQKATVLHLESLSLISHLASVDVKQHVYLLFRITCDESTVSLLEIRECRYIQDYYLIWEIKTWLNINHITVHNNTYCIF